MWDCPTAIRPTGAFEHYAGASLFVMHYDRENGVRGREPA
jgi:hypothetical protein